FDALIEQDPDLSVRSAILNQLIAQIGLAGLGRCRGFSLKTGDVCETQSQIYGINAVRELIASSIAVQRPEDHESSNVEIVQHEQRKIVVTADLIDEEPCGGDGYALGRKDHDVVTVGQIHLL